MPKVSIIIPTYNRARYLKEAIQSILNQTFDDFEIIVTDNASTDDTELIVYSFNEKRIKYFKNKENLGVVKNHNLALSKCTGEYIQIFSDDDLMDLNNLKLKVSILDKYQNVGLVHSNVRTINSNGEIIENKHWARNYYKNWRLSHLQNRLFNGLFYAQILYENWNIISMPSVMIRTSVLKNIGDFDIETKYFCDWDLWIRMALVSDVYYLSKVLISYRKHDNNTISETTLKKSIDELCYIKKKVCDKKNLNINCIEISRETKEQHLKYPLKETLINKIFDKVIAK
jgi:glycosyltransferase involved in cell wall biosynthesis